MTSYRYFFHKITEKAGTLQSLLFECKGNESIIFDVLAVLRIEHMDCVRCQSKLDGRTDIE